MRDLIGHAAYNSKNNERKNWFVFDDAGCASARPGPNALVF